MEFLKKRTDKFCHCMDLRTGGIIWGFISLFCGIYAVLVGLTESNEVEEKERIKFYERERIWFHSRVLPRRTISNSGMLIPLSVVAIYWEKKWIIFNKFHYHKCLFFCSAFVVLVSVCFLYGIFRVSICRLHFSYFNVDMCKCKNFISFFSILILFHWTE